MKFAVKFVLLIFITFLSTPTIVSLIENSCDTSVFYSMTEEELVHKEIKEVKAELRTYNVDLTSLDQQKSSAIMSKNNIRHDNVTAAIFSPPPNA